MHETCSCIEILHLPSLAMKHSNITVANLVCFLHLSYHHINVLVRITGMHLRFHSNSRGHPKIYNTHWPLTSWRTEGSTHITSLYTDIVLVSRTNSNTFDELARHLLLLLMDAGMQSLCVCVCNDMSSWQKHISLHIKWNVSINPNVQIHMCVYRCFRCSIKYA